MQLPPIAATTIGSFPRPGWLANATRSQTTFNLEGDRLREGLDDATSLAIRDQELAGLDLVTDGEQRRPHFIDHILNSWDGVDTVNRVPKGLYRRREEVHEVPRVHGAITRRTPAVTADLRFAKGRTDRPLKMAVPGPMTVVDSTLDDHYGDEAAMAMDVAAALNGELRELQAAGCDVVQIDEPAMTRYHEKVAAYGARALDRCVEGITIPTIVHLCYGYPGGKSLQHEYEYPELFPLLLETNIGGFAVEFARSSYDPAILEPCRDRLVLFGCVDPSDTPVPPVASVVSRVRDVLRYLDPEKLLLAPDCGLMTVSRELAFAKARLLADTAAELRRTL